MFNNSIYDLEFVNHIGKMAIFYLPVTKLTPEISKNIEDFLLDNFEGFTHERSNIKGKWKSYGKIFEDVHERYEVSFKGLNKVVEFLYFISNLCEELQEDSIYLTMGEHSWLVKKHS